MAASLPETPAYTFRGSEAGELDRRNLLARATGQMSLWPQGLVDFT